jgi:hypothetical protein
MIVNPFTQELAVYPSTRLLKSTFDIIGATLKDPDTPDLTWAVHALFAPLPKRSLGGIRAKLVATSGLVSFINQRDLEVLLGQARPGKYCDWLRATYQGPTDKGWCGLCMDSDDLEDDLHERELCARAASGGQLPIGMELTRLLHMDEGHDVEELITSISDHCPETGLTPDSRLETIRSRWSRIEARRL